MKLRKMNAKTSATSFSEISSKEENNDSLNMSKSSIIQSQSMTHNATYKYIFAC